MAYETGPSGLLKFSSNIFSYCSVKPHHFRCNLAQYSDLDLKGWVADLKNRIIIVPFHAEERLVQLQNGALWHENREEELETC